MPVTKQEILLEIKKYVDTNGEVPGERSFQLATRIKESAWRGRFWARWTDAVREAGYDPNELTQKIPDQELLEKLAGFVTELGRFPIRDEINVRARSGPGFPVWQTIKKRYGGMPETAAALLEFGKSTGNALLVQHCQERIQREISKPVPALNGAARVSEAPASYI